MLYILSVCVCTCVLVCVCVCVCVGRGFDDSSMAVVQQYPLDDVFWVIGWLGFHDNVHWLLQWSGEE